MDTLKFSALSSHDGKSHRIYLLESALYPDLYKVGYTSQWETQTRINQINLNDRYEMRLIGEWLCPSRQEALGAERRVHETLKEYRTFPQWGCGATEYFTLGKDQARLLTQIISKEVDAAFRADRWAGVSALLRAAKVV